MAPRVRLPLLVCLPALLTVFVGSCGGDAPERVTASGSGSAGRSTGAGQGIWEAAGEAPWTLRETVQIGAVDGAGPETFGAIASLTADALENVWVVDGLAREVRVFAPSGEHIRTVGGRGQGPGEFMRPGPAFSGPGGTIWIEDLSLRRWEVFDTGGQRVAGYSVQSSLGGGWRQWTSDGRFLVLDAGPGGSPSGVIRVYVLDESGQRLAPSPDSYPLPEIPPPPLLTLHRAGSTISVPAPLSARPWGVLTQAGQLWIGTGHAGYELRRLSLDGVEEVTVRREYAPIPIPEEERRQAWAAVLEQFPGSRPVSEDGGSMIPEHYPPFYEGVASTDGSLWVRRQVTADQQGVDVFQSDGRLLGTIQVPESLVEAEIRVVTAGHVWALAVDDLGVPSVLGYSISRR